MTISFHSELRNGDYVMSMVTKILIEEMGLKDITIAASSLGGAQDLTISSNSSPTSISGR
ncbi:citrate lyase subunit alpha [Fusobacterium polymorphum]|uniref:citrate lyase subunit alpha n=1 Tax=Fusobacterium nucleatum subsp. polymorphum TaxID=76857 RepID=UPI0021C42D10